MKKGWIRGVTVAGLAAAVLGFALVAVQTGQAGEEKKAAKQGEEYYHGEIHAVDFKAGTVTIKQGDAGTMTFQTTPGSKYFVKQKKEGARFSDFHVGDKVEVWYVVESGASSIRTLAEEGSHVKKKMKKEGE